MNRMYIIILLSLFSVLSGLQCKKPTPPDDDKRPYAQSIELTKDEVGVTEAWLRVKFLDSLSGSSFKLTRNGETILTTASSKYDTAVIDNGLLPNKTYNYRAYRLRLNTVVDSSSVVTLTTMDTTSHDFTWTSYEFGEVASNDLYDVAIVNDTCVWVVGEIYKRDSTGQFDPNAYNAAYWNGVKWELKRILVNSYPGIIGYWPLHAVFAFSPNDVWVSSYDNLIHWDGNAWTSKANFMVDVPFNGQVLKMWGTSGNNIYCVGRTGAIYHYTGASWTKIESGTTLNIYDIYGAKDAKAGADVILALASNREIRIESKILQISGTSVNYFNDDGLSWSMQSIWFRPNLKYYAVGGGIFRKSMLSDQNSWEMYPLGQVASCYSEAVRGTDINDVFVVGDFGEIVHFNGYGWKNYRNITGLPSGAYNRVAVKGNMVIAVGYNSSRAKAIIGTRQTK